MLWLCVRQAQHRPLLREGASVRLFLPISLCVAYASSWLKKSLSGIIHKLQGKTQPSFLGFML
jgi:hypothetical protein